METYKEKENRREASRTGAVLKVLKEPYPYPTGDEALQDNLKEQYPQLTPWGNVDVRAIVEYLKGHGFVEYEKTTTGLREYWGIKLTSKGIDYLRGYGENLPGVDRD